MIDFTCLCPEVTELAFGLKESLRTFCLLFYLSSFLKERVNSQDLMQDIKKDP